MRTTRLYIPEPIAEGSSPVITLSADDSRYLLKVMRYSEGDKIELFNGDGNSYTASILKAGKTAEVQVLSVKHTDTESPVSITLVQALAKGTKLDLVIQKATELGVSRITPVSTERSVLQIDPKRAQKKAEHWSKVARSACAQCNRSIVPVIDPVIALDQWFRDHANENSVLIHPDARKSFKDLPTTDALNILVGPEGGFSDNELKMAAESGVETLRCGPRVLRTETAGFAAITMVQAQIGDMR